MAMNRFVKPLQGQAGVQVASGTKSASGDQNVIAAPGAGTQIVIAAIALQNLSAVATTMILKNGPELWRFLGQSQGQRDMVVFPVGRELRCGDGLGITLNLSGANSCGYTIVYWLESTNA